MKPVEDEFVGKFTSTLAAHLITYLTAFTAPCMQCMGTVSIIIIIIIKDIYIVPFRHAPKALCEKKVKC